ncbi:putative ABC transporter CDR4 [Glarea lozoyensis 74030]|uniref:Putative ABC transporter CDR4 n=1 Tax=Glarea lozoyensis (strain ATCC 74030 / MF5533) TaxID=1104152 RepID=H0EI48_GLAL7|nr:putative ABC transporter CDR4 [Glarea lozoyensis 74030]
MVDQLRKLRTAERGWSMICSSVGALPGQTFVDGTTYLKTVFNYSPDHLWRNYWILLIMMLGLCATHILSSEYILAKKSKGEVLLFLCNKALICNPKMDEEAKAGQSPGIKNLIDEKNKQPEAPKGLNDHSSTFCWDNLCYDIKAEGKPKRPLNEVNGWVKKGTLTALMGATGAGKTTMLDVLS